MSLASYVTRRVRLVTLTSRPSFAQLSGGLILPAKMRIWQVMEIREAIDEAGTAAELLSIKEVVRKIVDMLYPLKGMWCQRDVVSSR